MKDMSAPSWRLSTLAIRNGAWEGVASRIAHGEGDPAIELHHQGAKVAEAQVSETDQNNWSVKVSIPVEALNDGVQTFALVDRETGLALNTFGISLGEALESDLRAEVELLRAELDLLKRAFRRHCSES